MQERLDAIHALGAQLVAVTQSRPAALAAQLGREPPPFPFLGDPERTAYRAFGLERGRWGMIFRPHVVAHYLRRMLQGWVMRLPYPGEDVLQLGGDFILDRAGRLVFAHRSTDPSDRPAVDELLRRLRAVSGGEGRTDAPERVS